MEEYAAAVNKAETDKLEGCGLTAMELGVVYIPFVISTLGSLGLQALNTTRGLAYAFSERYHTSSSIVSHRFKSQLAVVVARGNARSFASQLSSTRPYTARSYGHTYRATEFNHSF